MERRTFLQMLTVGLAASLTGCGEGARRAVLPTLPAPSSTSTSTSTSTTLAPLPVIPPAHPGPPVLFGQKHLPTPMLALTIDDGYDVPTATAYVEFAQRTGIHITFSPNGAYHSVWDKLAPQLRPLIQAGQVQIGNHTYNHPYLTRLTPTKVRDELQRNEEWIETTFGITARPWYRPPYGVHNKRVDVVAGELGFTNVLLWDGTFGDSTVQTPETLLRLAQQYLLPGTVMLGHANHPPIIALLDQIHQLIEDRQLQPVTLDEMFGTSRAIG